MIWEVLIRLMSYTDYIFMIIQKWRIYNIKKKLFHYIRHNYYIRYICMKFIYYVPNK